MIVSVSRYFVVQLKWAVLVFLPLLCAGSIYIFFRSHHTVVNVLLANFIEIPVSQSNNYWLVYCLPGGLWLFSFQLAILLFVHSHHRILLILSLLWAVGIEYLQFLHVTDGFFDWLDVYTYLIFSVLSFLIYSLKKQFYPVSTQSNNLFKYYIFAFFGGIVFLSDLF